MNIEPTMKPEAEPESPSLLGRRSFVLGAAAFGLLAGSPAALAAAKKTTKAKKVSGTIALQSNNADDKSKKGMEAVKGFTLGGFVPPMEISPADHEGGGWVQIWTVKGGKLVKVKDWFQGNRPTIQKHLAADASKS